MSRVVKPDDDDDDDDPVTHSHARVPQSALYRHRTGRKIMLGIALSPSASGEGDIASMKRKHSLETVPTFGERHAKKRKVLHRLKHIQPSHHITDPISGELDSFGGDDKDFFDQQLRRAIAIQCKVVGFESARPDALENFRGLVDSYMNHLLAQVRKSMSSSRRTRIVPHDWVYALAQTGLRGSAVLEQHFDMGDIPPSLVQPQFEPPAALELAPPSTESLLGPELSGKIDKETRSYIPKNFPEFPSKHTYQATPVFTKRENDPRKIREKATEEGILAEQSLRKLMAAQKVGIQKQSAGKRKRSKRMEMSDQLWQAAMKDLLVEEAEREQEEQRQAHIEEDDVDEWEQPLERRARQPVMERNLNLEEGVHINYEQRFCRKSARVV